MSEGRDTGRPTIEEEAQDRHNIAMTPSLWTALVDYAKELNTSVSAVLRTAAKRELQRAGKWTNRKDADA